MHWIRGYSLLNFPRSLSSTAVYSTLVVLWPRDLHSVTTLIRTKTGLLHSWHQSIQLFFSTASLLQWDSQGTLIREITTCPISTWDNGKLQDQTLLDHQDLADHLKKWSKWSLFSVHPVVCLDLVRNVVFIFADNLGLCHNVYYSREAFIIRSNRGDKRGDCIVRD